MSQIVKIHLAEKVVTLKFDNLELEVDVDSYLKVDYGNLMGDIITFPVFFSQISQLRAEAESNVNEAKMSLEIYAAKQRGYYRKKLFADNSKKPTVEELADAIALDQGYQNEQKKYINAQRDFGYLDALYWSAKSKDGKLNKIIDKMQTIDAQDVVEGTFNGIMIKTTQAHIVKKN